MELFLKILAQLTETIFLFGRNENVRSIPIFFNVFQPLCSKLLKIEIFGYFSASFGIRDSNEHLNCAYRSHDLDKDLHGIFF